MVRDLQHPAGTSHRTGHAVTGSARIIRGNALSLPLADGSVDLVCTSPPYFGLRSYTDGGQHYDDQIGAEATPAEFVDALIAATREMVRVLKQEGSIFVNLGDKYAGAPSGPRRLDGDGWTTPAKSLMGIPWRYALRCIDDLGLILRAEIIWHKSNSLPESVGDRVRRSHEQWFHLVKQPRYFTAVDEIREVHDAASRGTYKVGPSDVRDFAQSTLGKLPGSVWTIPTQPLTVPDHLGVDHYAAFPMEWPRRIIRGWTPSGICVECGQGRRPVSERELTNNRKGRQSHRGISAVGGGGVGSLGWERETTITGYACDCTPTREIVSYQDENGNDIVKTAYDLTAWTPRPHHPRRRPRPIRRHRNHRPRRQSPRPHRHHRRPESGLLPPR
ncbi:MAG: DNA-methyltransferase [Acidimicrobiia bacterium]